MLVLVARGWHAAGRLADRRVAQRRYVVGVDVESDWSHPDRTVACLVPRLDDSVDSLGDRPSSSCGIEDANQTPARPGSVLTCGIGSWTGASSYAYQFLLVRVGDFFQRGRIRESDGRRGGRGRNSVLVQTFSVTNTRTVTTADPGATFQCVVRASNAGGSTPANSSTLTAPAAPTTVTPPALSWRNPLRVGTKVSTTTGTWTPTSPALSYSYRWTRNGFGISGATTSTYAIQSADVGSTIRSQVMASNTSGPSTWVSSSNAVTP